MNISHLTVENGCFASSQKKGRGAIYNGGMRRQMDETNLRRAFTSYADRAERKDEFREKGFLGKAASSQIEEGKKKKERALFSS